MRKIRNLTIAVSILTSLQIVAQTTVDRESDRVKLRQILSDIQEGINEKNIERILPNLTEHVVVIYQNAEVSHGRTDVENYFKSHFFGPNPMIKKFRIEGKILAPAEFYGDTAIAYGTTIDDMEVASGKKFLLQGKWSASLVSQEGVWRISSLHFSTNVLDNPVIDGVVQMGILAAVIALLAGVGLGYVIFRLKGRKP